MSEPPLTRTITDADWLFRVALYEVYLGLVRYKNRNPSEFSSDVGVGLPRGAGFDEAGNQKYRNVDDFPPGWVEVGYELWLTMCEAPKDYFLRLPTPDLHGTLPKEATYAHAAAMSRKLLTARF